MSGLFAKDFALLKQRKQGLLTFLIIMVIMGLSTGRLFLAGYGTMLFAFFGHGTISYDSFDNGMEFLMTLPIRARDYVKEKFLFCGICSLAGWLTALVCSVVIAFAKGESIGLSADLIEMIGQFPIIFAMISFVIAVQFKYGPEKSRFVLAAIAGIILVGVVLARKFFESNTPSLPSQSGGTDILILAVMFAVSTVIVLASYLWSCKIMEAKEY